MGRSKSTFRIVTVELLGVCTESEARGKQEGKALPERDVLDK
jgi:hypothetical protein